MTERETRSVQALMVAIAILGSSSGALAWDAGPCACMHNDAASCAEGRGNTHLWIVNNAIHLLAQSTDPTDRAIVRALKEPSCRTEWEQGLWEVDCRSDTPGCFGPATSLGDPPAVGSHFYNATGKDFFGEPQACPTYLVLESCVSSESARESGEAQLRRVGDLGSTGSCRALGRALHYFTDTTMPFHASGLSGASIFVNSEDPSRLLHPTWENWVGTRHDRFPARGSWQKVGQGGSADELFALASKKSHTYMAPYFEAMGLSKEIWIWSEDSFPDTSRVLGEMLKSAYQATASYLRLACKNRVEP